MKQWSWTIFHHHLAGRHRADDLDADRALAKLVDEACYHVERDIGFEQRAPHLPRRGIDIGGGEGAAPGQPVENSRQLVGQAIEHLRAFRARAMPASRLRRTGRLGQTPIPPEGASRCRALTSGLTGPGGSLFSALVESAGHLWRDERKVNRGVAI